MYVYKRTEFSPYCLYTVGYYEPDGKWMPESDHEKESDAADRVTLLNGEPHVAIPLHREQGEEDDVTNDFLKRLIEIELNKMDKSNFGHIRKIVIGLVGKIDSHPSPQSEQAGEKVEQAAEKWYHTSEGFDKMDAFKAGALWQAASQEKGVGWVSIADNLHENITVQTNDCTIDVLVRTDNADSPVAVAFYNKKRKEWWLSEKDDVELTVTYWRPLPAPPKPNNEIK